MSQPDNSLIIRVANIAGDREPQAEVYSGGGHTETGNPPILTHDPSWRVVFSSAVIQLSGSTSAPGSRLFTALAAALCANEDPAR